MSRRITSHRLTSQQGTAYDDLLLERAAPVLVTIVLVVTAAQDAIVLAGGIIAAPTAANLTLAISVVAVWLIALAIPEQRLRWTIQVLAMVAVVIAPLVTAMETDAWATTTALAIAIAFAAPLALSLPMITAIAGLQWAWAVAPPTGVVLPPGPLGALSLPLVTLLGVGGLALTRQGLWQSMLRADADLSMQQERLAAERYRTQAESARAAVARRIHETALNTLAAVSMGSVDPQALRHAARRDLAAADGSAHQDMPRSLCEAIDTACSSIPVGDLTITQAVAGDATLDESAAQALRDALVEALRNVQRHSGGSRAHIDATARDDVIRVSVSDEGAGFAASAPERFGISEALRSSMARMGGTASVESARGSGTTVTLTMPTSPQAREWQPRAAVRLLDDSLLARMGLTGFAVFAGVAAPALAGDFGSRSMLILLLAFVASIVSLAMLWNTRARVGLAIASLAILVVAYTALVWTSTAGTAFTCAVSTDVVWMGVTAGGGGTLLAVLAFRRTAATAIAVVVAIAAPALALLALPAACREPQYAIRNAVYILGALVLVTWINRSFERQRNATALAWGALLDEGARAHAAAAEAAAWRRLDGEPRDLLELLAEGADPTLNDDTRARASRCASLLRNRLRSRYPEPLQGLLDALQGSVAAPVDVDVFDVADRDGTPLPSSVIDRVVESLTDGGRRAPRSLRVALFRDEGEETITIGVEGTAISPTVGTISGVEFEAATIGNARSLLTITRRLAAGPPDAQSH